MIQGLTRNPLGDPGLLGVNAGASASLVITAAVLGGAAGRSVWAAVPGRSSRRSPSTWWAAGADDATPVRLVLAGAAVSAVLVALVEGITLANPEVFDTYRFWVVGSLAGRPAVDGRRGAAVRRRRARPVPAAGPPAERARARRRDRDLPRRALRSHPACSARPARPCCARRRSPRSGPIAFVGLAVPHVVRSFTGADHRWLLPYCLVLGPVLLLAADVVGRVVARPGELPVGAVTAFVGAPFLILAVRRGRVGL